MHVIDQHLQCQTCGYDLRGLIEHRCPECGGMFDLKELQRADKDDDPPFRAHGICAFVVLLLAEVLVTNYARSGPISRASLTDLALQWIPLIFSVGLGFGISLAGIIRGDLANRVCCGISFVSFAALSILLDTAWWTFS